MNRLRLKRSLSVPPESFERSKLTVHSKAPPGRVQKVIRLPSVAQSYYLPSVTARLDSVVDTMDCLVDMFGSAFEVMDSLKDACDSVGHAMSQPAPWCRSLAENDPTYVGEGV